MNGQKGMVITVMCRSLQMQKGKNNSPDTLASRDY